MFEIELCTFSNMLGFDVAQFSISLNKYLKLQQLVIAETDSKLIGVNLLVETSSCNHFSVTILHQISIITQLAQRHTFQPRPARYTSMTQENKLQLHNYVNIITQLKQRKSQNDDCQLKYRFSCFSQEVVQ